MKNSIFLLNRRVDRFSFGDATEFCLSAINEGRSIQVITINPEMIMASQGNNEFAQVINSSDLNVPDGIGIKYALKFRGEKIENIRGVEFSKNLLKIASEKDLRVALFGAKEEVLQAAIQKLKEEFPTLNIVYARNGYFDDDTVIKEEIISANPNILLVALGAPKQEFFIKSILDKLNACVAVGVGGSFDVYSGLVKEAPQIWQKLGLEWLYRTLIDPKRFKRIFPTLPLFLIKCIMEKTGNKR
ncbi:WecB/TagA/CpsF family glycosyltransferase [bacterium]|nr:WecB/TagA/CpsF family glycosyltransferase [bacterium]